eukprot:184126-Pyramimonas_sp.AAC.1
MCPTKEKEQQATSPPQHRPKGHGRGKSGSRHYANQEVSGTSGSTSSYGYHSMSAASWHHLPDLDGDSPDQAEGGLTGTT